MRLPAPTARPYCRRRSTPAVLRGESHEQGGSVRVSRLDAHSGVGRDVDAARRRIAPTTWISMALAALAALWVLVLARGTSAGAAVTDPGEFIVTVLDGLTIAGLLFVVASGFTLIFGLMRTVNMAHGSLFLLAAYFAAHDWPHEMVGEDEIVRADLQDVDHVLGEVLAVLNDRQVRTESRRLRPQAGAACGWWEGQPAAARGARRPRRSRRRCAARAKARAAARCPSARNSRNSRACSSGTARRSRCGSPGRDMACRGRRARTRFRAACSPCTPSATAGEAGAREAMSL